MRSLTIFTLLFFFFTAVNAATHSTIKSGDWDDARIWSNGVVPSISSWPGEAVVINHKVEVDGDLKFSQGASMTVNDNASLEIDGQLKMSGSGTFLINASGVIECESVKHTGWDGSFTVKGDLIVEEGIEITGVAEFYTEGNVYAESLAVKGSGYFESNGGTINIEEDLEIKGGTNFKVTKTDFVIEGSFKRTGGPNIIFTGGTMSVGEDFIGSGGGSICFDGTMVKVEEQTTLSGSVIIYIGGRGTFDTKEVKMNGAAAILGKDMGGWFNCVEMELSGSAKIKCVDGQCEYDSSNGNEMPSVLDLGASSVLPVELLYFEATASVDGMLNVNWATAVEINNDFFTIELSNNGKDWKSLAEVKGAGNSDVTIDYEWKSDRVNAVGTVYLRLKQTDFDGTFSYSDIASVNLGKRAAAYEVNIYPNPATEYVVIEGITADETPQIFLVNLQGQQINISQTDEGTSTRLNIPTQLPAGTYGLVIQSGDQVQTERIVIQK